MPQRGGEHTWDMTWHYHLCPKCSYIIESRQPYTCHQGKYFKDLICPRCQHSFRLYKEDKPSSFSFFGSEGPMEWDWPDRE